MMLTLIMECLLLDTVGSNIHSYIYCNHEYSNLAADRGLQRVREYGAVRFHNFVPQSPIMRVFQALVSASL